MEAHFLTQIITKDFVEEVEESMEEKPKEKEARLISGQKSEKFRYENSTAAKNRRSIDSSALLSNLSLSEVFEQSTDKKLLHKSNILHDTLIPQNNIILEEDSNFNLNTFSMNLKSNFNQCELEFPQAEEEIEEVLFNIESINREIEKVLNLKHNLSEKM
jgi:hypothetical protein